MELRFEQGSGTDWKGSEMGTEIIIRHNRWQGYLIYDRTDGKSSEGYFEMGLIWN